MTAVCSRTMISWEWITARLSATSRGSSRASTSAAGCLLLKRKPCPAYSGIERKSSDLIERESAGVLSEYVWIYACSLGPTYRNDRALDPKSGYDFMAIKAMPQTMSAAPTMRAAPSGRSGMPNHPNLSMASDMRMLAVMVRPAKAPAPTRSTNSSPASTANPPTSPPSGAPPGHPAEALLGRQRPGSAQDQADEHRHHRQKRDQARKPGIGQRDAQDAVHRRPPRLQRAGGKDDRVEPGGVDIGHRRPSRRSRVRSGADFFRRRAQAAPGGVHPQEKPCSRGRKNLERPDRERSQKCDELDLVAPAGRQGAEGSEREGHDHHPRQHLCERRTEKFLESIGERIGNEAQNERNNIVHLFAPAVE